MEQLYSQMPLGIVATLAIGGIATYELWDERTRDLVLFWWGLVLLITAARAALYFGYRRSKDRLAEAGQWLRWLGISALANGVNWGFAGAVFFPSHTDEQQVFLAFLLAGIASAGILEGDLLAVHRTQEARSGQVVVARLADEVTVKRFRRRGHSVQLLPENPDFEPIEVDLRRDTLSIEGVAVGVIRNGKGL